MIVFPAIDLKGGQVVRLAEGDMDRATIYGELLETCAECHDILGLRMTR